MAKLPEGIPPGNLNEKCDESMSYPQKTIAECAEIISGLVEQKDSGAASCLYEAVLPSQITPAGFIPEYGQIQRIPTSYMPFLNAGDVIIKRLNPDCAVVFEDKAVQALPSANLFVIRPNTRMLDPYYLAFILESSKALNRISQRSGIGTAVSAVTAIQIKNCEIPLPPLEQQRKLGVLWKCAKERNNLLQKLIAENDRLLRSISEKLYQ